MKNWLSKLNLAGRPFFLEGVLIAATLAWGLSFIWIKQATLAGLGPNAFIVLRYGLAAVLMLPFCLPELRRVSRPEIGYGVLIGVLMYLAVVLQTIGMAHTTPANSAFITTAYVALVPFTSWIVLGHRPRAWVWLPIGLCLVGVYVLTLGPGGSLSANVGNLMMLGCAVMWGFQVAILTRAGRVCGVKMLTLIPLLVMFVLALAGSLIRRELAFEGVDLAAALPPTVLCSLFPTLLAGVAQAYAQRHVQPAKAAVIYTLEAVFACVISVMLGMEKLSSSLFLGGGLILGAVVLSQNLDRREVEKLRESPRV